MRSRAWATWFAARRGGQRPCLAPLRRPDERPGGPGKPPRGARDRDGRHTRSRLTSQAFAWLGYSRFVSSPSGSREKCSRSLLSGHYGSAARRRDRGNRRLLWLTAANEALLPGISDVEFGEGRRRQAFTNLYGCRLGDESHIGPFVEIQAGAVVGVPPQDPTTPSSAPASSRERRRLSSGTA